MLSYKVFFFIILFSSVVISLVGVVNANIKTGFPVVKDSNLEVKVVAEGLYLPTNMQFIDNDTVIVTEQKGIVKIVDLSSNGKAVQKPILNVNATKVAVENGLVGLAVRNDISEGNLISNDSDNVKDRTKLSDVFLYFSEGDGEEARNRLYKYSFDGQNLRNKSLLLDLPTNNLSIHNGGKIIFG